MPLPPSWLAQLLEISVQQCIGVTATYIYFRAAHTALGSVVVQCCRVESDPVAMSGLWRQFKLTRKLQHVPSVYIPIQMLRGPSDSHYALLLPDHAVLSLMPSSTCRADELTLGTYLDKHPFIDVDQAQILLRQTASILANIHACGLVYCNISLDTLILRFPSATEDWSRVSVRLSDFAFIRQQGSDLVSPSTVELGVCGDTRFMSPESTGRTNRPVDETSDIYSLGMLLHGALTGSFPRREANVLEMIQYHVVSTPPSLTAEHITEDCSYAQAKAAAFQRLLVRMHAKLPEERFRSCSDLLYNLDRFDAAANDNPLQFQPSALFEPADMLQLLNNSKLYGCENEIRDLRLFQQEVYEGFEGGLVVVSGPSGVGKTALVNELVLPTCKSGGFFCSGKYEQFKAELPYLAFVEACSELITLLLSDDNATVIAIVEAVVAQIGDNVRLMLEVVPNLRHLLAAGGVATDDRDQPAQAQSTAGLEVTSAAVHPERVLQRLQKALACFLAIVSAHRPLTIFVDDIQWADNSSMKLITDLLTNAIPRRLLLVLAHRTHEATTSSSLIKLYNALVSKRSHLPLREIQLGNLDIVATKSMLSDLLNPTTAAEQEAELDRLAGKLQNTTLGNALFVRRSLQALVESGALTLATQTERWSWDEAKGGNLLAVDSAVDMFTMQLKCMPPSTRFPLAVGALLGHSFDVQMVANLLDLPFNSVMTALEPAVRGGYIRSTSGAQTMVFDDGLDVAADESGAARIASFTALRDKLDLPGLSLLDDLELLANGVRYDLVPRKSLDPARQAASPAMTNSVMDMGRWTSQRPVAADQSPVLVQSSASQPSSTTYQWAHDRLQQAASRLVDESEHDMAYMTIGFWLLKRMVAKDASVDLDEIIFDIVHHLGLASANFTSLQDKVNYIKLLTVACSRARARSAFDTALRYAEQAVKVVDEQMWDKHYNIAFRAHHSLIAALFDCSRFEELSVSITLVLQRELELYHRAMILELQASMFSAQTHFDETIRCGSEALALLGFPIVTDAESIQEIIRRTPTTPEDVLRLSERPQIQDLHASTAIRIAATLVAAMWVMATDKFPGLVACAMNITFQYGNSECGCFFYGLYGMQLQSQNQLDLGYAYNKLALQCLAAYPASHITCAVVACSGQQALGWTDSLAHVEQVMRKAIEVGQTLMNDEYLGYCVGTYLDAKLAQGFNLNELRAECFRHLPLVQNRITTLASGYCGVLHDCARHLTSPKFTPIAQFIDPTSCTGQDFFADPLQQLAFRQIELLLYVIADDIPAARKCIDEYNIGSLTAIQPSANQGNYNFYLGLILLRAVMLDREADHTDLLMTIETVVAKHELWARYCPSTFQCRYELLLGTLQWLQGHAMTGLKHLGRAIDLAKRKGYIHIDAIANETVSRLWEMDGQAGLAAPYKAAALRAYQQWGAEWKARSMEDMPPARSASTASSYDEDDATAAALNRADGADIEAVSKWTDALASQQARKDLLTRFMRIVLMYTAGREGTVLWSKSHETPPKTFEDLHCYIAASTVNDAAQPQIVFQSEQTMLGDMAAVVNYVLRTKETLIDSSEAFKSLVRRGIAPVRPGSFLLAPIVCHGQCFGVLWLANSLTPGMLGNHKRLLLLQLLSSQLALSLDNIRLNGVLGERNDLLQAQTVTLEAMVRHRTSALEQVNKRLSNEVVERQKAEEIANQSAAFNRTFLHNMSHELRTPLNCIVGMAELLKHTLLSKEQLELCRPLFSSAEDLLHIVNDVLDLSKIQAGELVLKQEEFSLRDVVERAIDSVALQADKKSLVLAALYSSSTPSALRSDGKLIGQVLRNLLSNAVKFTERGQVVLEVAAAPIAGRNGEYLFTVTCTDTGIGIHPEHAHRLFKPFSQIDSSNTRKFGGTGLGLSISKDFARILSGDMTCESEVGKGSKFTFTFESQAMVSQGPGISLPSPMTIAVCHPQPVIRQMLQGYLTFGSHSVITLEPAALQETCAKLDAKQTHVFILPQQDASQLPTKYPRVTLLKAGSTQEPEAGSCNVREPIRQSELFSALSSVLPDPARSSKPKAQPQLVPALAVTQPQFSLRVLVAEDNPINQRVVRKLLLKFGLEPKLVDNGREAVSACEQQDYDLVLMDIMMPLMDGQEATRVIRQTLPQDKQPKIVALTANAFDEDRRTYTAAGMDATVTKPLQLQALREMLLQFFPPVAQT
ncbi:hypothetical protein RI367_004078 [Sorochytrium milnesiophthora]